MFPNISREYSQFLSAACMTAGLALFLSGEIVGGCVAVGSACWVLLMSESILLSRVHNEMQRSLEELAKTKAKEVDEALYFLRQSKISAHPLESIESASCFIEKLNHPAFLLGPAMGIMQVNTPMATSIGYERDELIGQPAHLINDHVLMSYSGNLVNQPPYKSLGSLSLRYFYVHKDGSRVWGSLHVVKIIDGCFFMVFHPDKENILNDEKIKSILSK